MKWMYKMTKEMRETIDALYESVGYDCNACCEKCPYADICGQDNGDLHWQCSVWEDSMGEDL